MSASGDRFATRDVLLCSPYIKRISPSDATLILEIAAAVNGAIMCMQCLLRVRV